MQYFEAIRPRTVDEKLGEMHQTLAALAHRIEMSIQIAQHTGYVPRERELAAAQAIVTKDAAYSAMEAAREKLMRDLVPTGDPEEATPSAEAIAAALGPNAEESDALERYISPSKMTPLRPAGAAPTSPRNLGATLDGVAVQPTQVQAQPQQALQQGQPPQGLPEVLPEFQGLPQPQVQIQAVQQVQQIQASMQGQAVQQPMLAQQAVQTQVLTHVTQAQLVTHSPPLQQLQSLPLHLQQPLHLGHPQLPLQSQQQLQALPTRWPQPQVQSTALSGLLQSEGDDITMSKATLLELLGGGGGGSRPFANVDAKFHSHSLSRVVGPSATQTPLPHIGAQWYPGAGPSAGFAPAPAFPGYAYPGSSAPPVYQALPQASGFYLPNGLHPTSQMQAQHLYDAATAAAAAGAARLPSAEGHGGASTSAGGTRRRAGTNSNITVLRLPVWSKFTSVKQVNL